MDSEYAFSATALLDPYHGIGGEPVMGMDNIKRTDIIFGLKDMMHKRTAHFIDFCNEICIQREGAAMVMNSIDALVPLLVRPHARKNMNIMTFSLQSRRQLGDMYSHPPHGNRMEGLPG